MVMIPTSRSPSSTGAQGHYRTDRLDGGSHELLVLDEGGALVGVVCHCDLTLHGAATVGECMPRDLYVTDTATTMGETCSAMDSLALSCVPVVDGPRVIGVLGGYDLVRAGMPTAIHAWHRGCKRARNEEPEP